MQSVSRRCFVALSTLWLCVGQSQIAASQDVSRPVVDRGGAFSFLNKTQGQGRFITVLTVYDRTRFFFGDGQLRGFEFELMREFESYMNERAKDETERVTLFFMPVPFDEVIPRLVAGEADMAAAGLTITPQREALVLFSDPYMEDVAELMIAGPVAPKLDKLEDLAGQTVHVVDGTSYVGNLFRLSGRLVEDGFEPINVVTTTTTRSTEDLLGAVNSDAISYTVADSHLAQIWSQALSDMVVHEDLAIAEGGSLAWAVRPGSRALLEDLNSFVADARRGTLLGNIMFNRYFRDSVWLEEPVSEEALGRANEYLPLFIAQAEENGFRPALLLGLAMRESGFQRDLKSSAGAIGLMQLRPSTAAELGVTDLTIPEENIKAGARYLAYLRDRYLEEGLQPEVAERFALAAYNAGPARVRGLRQKTAEAGLDPDVWFFNVEQIAAREIGQETIRYLTHVYRYAMIFELSGQRVADASVTGEELSPDE